MCIYPVCSMLSTVLQLIGIIPPDTPSLIPGSLAKLDAGPASRSFRSPSRRTRVRGAAGFRILLTAGWSSPAVDLLDDLEDPAHDDRRQSNDGSSRSRASGRGHERCRWPASAVLRREGPAELAWLRSASAGTSEQRSMSGTADPLSLRNAPISRFSAPSCGAGCACLQGPGKCRERRIS